MTQKFAAYDDASIYAVADTSDAAIAKAREDAREPTAQFSTAYISDDLAAWIDENGWHGPSRSFAVRDGEIVDTTAL
jgi:hypothetical protein